MLLGSRRCSSSAAIALGALNGPGDLDVHLCVVTLAVWIVTFAIWIRSRILLARDMSEYLDTKISWFQLPRMSPRATTRGRRRGSSRRDRAPSSPSLESPLAKGEDSDPEPEPVGEAGRSRDPEPVGESPPPKAPDCSDHSPTEPIESADGRADRVPGADRRGPRPGHVRLLRSAVRAMATGSG